MKQEKKDKAIKSFWKWFEANERRIREVIEGGSPYEKEALIEALDNQILEFGLFKWEMGPEEGGTFFLTISPNGNKDLLHISRLIMAYAPPLHNWTFYPAKPAKDGDLAFSLFDDFMEEHKIDVTEWEFVLLQAPENKISIIIKAPNVIHLETEIQIEAGDFAVTNLIGEENRIAYVNKINIVEDFDSHHQGKAVTHLRSEFEKALKDNAS